MVQCDLNAQSAKKQGDLYRDLGICLSRADLLVRRLRASTTLSSSQKHALTLAGNLLHEAIELLAQTHLPDPNAEAR